MDPDRPARHYNFDPAAWREDRDCLVTHNLADHPLLQLPALARLAVRHPPELIRYHSGHIPVTTNMENVVQVHPPALTLAEAMEDMTRAGAFVFLQRISRDPEYRGLVEECLREVRALVETRETGIHAGEGWVFISSPGIITPYHRDQESNFLMQIRGEKDTSVFPPEHPGVATPEELEFFHANRSLRATQFTEDKQNHAHQYRLKPGLGVYMPYTAPHWVRNGGAISVTFSVTYHSDQTRRRRNTYRVNYRLRRLGLRPGPVGARPWAEGLKDGVARMADWAKARLGREEGEGAYGR